MHHPMCASLSDIFQAQSPANVPTDLYGTEIFPTRIRGVCYASNMVFHWFFQFAVVRVTPNLLQALHIWGAFVFWACVCFAGFWLLAVMAPETKKVPMERMEELFEGRWYAGWKARADPRDAEFSEEMVARTAH